MHVPETEITVTKDGVELARRVVTPGEYVFGRGEDVDFHMDTPLASRHHARLHVNYDEWLIEDLASANGTFINDQPVAPNEATRVFPTQTLRVGDATVTLRRVRGSEAPDVSLAPGVAVGRTHLPEEVRARRYAIGKIVAQGGMGALLSAPDQAIRRGVAMKVMLQSGDAGDLTRFVEEAQITGQLEHPNIVPVHELGVDEQDQFFYTMKFVRGVTLRKVLELIPAEEATARKYPLGALLTIFQKVCDALAFAHSRDVIHRDLKPENIMLGDFGEVLVMDWGLAKQIRNAGVGMRNEDRAAADSAFRTPHSEFATMAGSIMGTPQYMAPEQARGEVETMDQRADIYALGAILFHLLFLRPSVSGPTAMHIVDKVQRGEVEWPSAKDLRRVPESLLAVCRKALALDPAQRYANVEDLQADITAYQTGFATSAEKAGAWKQITLLIKRHKATSIGIAAVLLVGITLGTKAIIEGRRAEREAVRATRALADLKRQAPALRQLAESEAGFQRFDSALDKLDAALALDPAHLPSYWRRAWLFIGMDRLADAAAAIRIAQQKDPAHGELAAILPTVEKLAALPPTDHWPADDAQRLWDHLVKVRASGETLALSGKLKLAAKDNEKLVRQRLDEWLGQGKAKILVEPSGTLKVKLAGLPIQTIQPLRGLPIHHLDVGETNVDSLDPLAGMRLTELSIFRTKVADLSPLRGAPLERLECDALKIADFSALHGAPLKTLIMRFNSARDLNFLADAPLEYLDTHANQIVELSPLRGKPLRTLIISQTNVSDLSPLRGAPIESLDVHSNRQIKDLTALLELPKLERLRVSKLGKLLEPLRNHPSLKYIAYDEEPLRPVAEFWAEYDAQQAAGKK